LGLTGKLPGSTYRTCAHTSPCSLPLPLHQRQPRDLLAVPHHPSMPQLIPQALPLTAVSLWRFPLCLTARHMWRRWMSWRGAPRPPEVMSLPGWSTFPPSLESAEIALTPKVFLFCARTLSCLALLLPIVLHTSCVLSLCMHRHISPGHVSAAIIPDLTANLLIWWQ